MTEDDIDVTINSISNISGVDLKDTTFIIETNKKEGTVRIIITVSSEEEGKIIVDTLKNFPEGDDCDIEILCRTISVRAESPFLSLSVSDMNSIASLAIILILSSLMAI